MKEKLKDCPFCGGKPQMWTVNLPYGSSVTNIRCMSFLCAGSQIQRNDKKIAIKRWNTRK